MFVALLHIMQVFCDIASNGAYDPHMKSGRPTDRKRPPFGERLYRLREQAGLTQAAVAEQMGTSARAYAFWERESVALKPEQMERLAQILGSSVEELLRGRKIKSPRGGPTGKVRRLFEEVSELPRSRQQRIVTVLEDMLTAAHQAR
jgi:transcriptional regulator with XRE-family HTH domain